MLKVSVKYFHETVSSTEKWLYKYLLEQHKIMALNNSPLTSNVLFLNIWDSILPWINTRTWTEDSTSLIQKQKQKKIENGIVLTAIWAVLFFLEISVYEKLKMTVLSDFGLFWKNGCQAYCFFKVATFLSGWISSQWTRQGVCVHLIREDHNAFPSHWQHC